MDEERLWMIKECQKMIDIMHKDREDISRCIGDELCYAYQETVELEISALEKVMKNLENY